MANNKTTSLDQLKNFSGSSTNSFFNNQLPNSNSSFQNSNGFSENSQNTFISPNLNQNQNQQQQQQQSDEPIGIPLDIENTNEHNQQNASSETKTVHNIMNHFENLSPQNQLNQQQMQNPFPSQLNSNGYIMENEGDENLENQKFSEEMINYENIPICSNKKKKLPLWKKIIKYFLKWSILTLFIFLFFYKPTQDILKKILHSFYHIEGHWNPKIILVFAVFISSLNMLFQFLIDKYIF